VTTQLSAKAKELVNRPILGNIATVDPDGRPQVTPVWIGLEGEDLTFNTAKGRVKQINMEKNPNVAVSVVDPDDPFNVVVVRGTVSGTEEGADAHIDGLAKKYMGVDSYPMRHPDEVRIKYVITADRVVMQSHHEA